MNPTPQWIRALAGVLLSSCGFGFAGEPARPGGYTPEEARARMTVPDGFAVSVFASEPEIRQPVAACFDERGRLWVIEYLQYPAPAGLKPVKVDQYLRTEYDRLPDPPPKGPRGADRIKILEDTDGDGRADVVKTFAEGLNLASGLAVGHGGVFVGQAPYLLFYPDADRDDLPDGDPQVLLTGFGLQDAHATVNSLAWGPDGWLYGAQGSTVTARIRGIEFQQGIWRYHPRTRAFELFAEGGGNTWGLDFDRGGHAFGSSNGGFVAFHMEQGGNSWKGFAKHGPLHNPRTFGYFDALEYQGTKRGGHVTPGGIIYKGDSFPERFRGAFIGGNLLSNAVYWHDLAPRGSTFTATHGGTLIDAHDAWFRPIDLLSGPDGSVFVVDWYDRRASHLDPRDNWDRTNGRIYKLSYRGNKAVPPFDLAKWSTPDLIALRTKVNDWWPETARRLLAERRDPEAVPVLRTLVLNDRDEARALRDLWALNASDGFDEAFGQTLLDHPVAGVRRWAIRLLGDRAEGPLREALRDRLIDLAGREPDPTVRCQLAATCQRLAPADAIAVLRRLAGRSQDVADTHVPLMIWWGVEKAMRSAPVLGAFGAPEAQRLPIVRAHLLERIARALAAEGSGSEELAAWLAQAPSEAEVDRIVAGMEKGLEGRRSGPVPPALVGPLKALMDRPDPSTARVRLAVRLGSEPAYRRALERVADARAPEADRVALIELIGQSRKPEGRQALLDLLGGAGGGAVPLALMNALGEYNDPEVADALLARYPSLTPQLRDRTRDLLCRRKAWAARLLDAVASGAVPARDLKTAEALQIVQHGDAELKARLEKVWGTAPGPNSAEKAKRIAEVRGILPEGDKGDPERGRAVFRDQCAGCHRLFGDGGAIGPDLGGADRGNLDFLLTSIIDPGAAVRKEYTAATVAMNDGRVLTGLVVEETTRTITLVDAKQQKTVLPRDEIDEIRASTASLMPEGLLDPLRDDQVRDLFRFLQSDGTSR